MTMSTPTGPHLDDEQLSAHIDGEASVEVTAHVTACPNCSQRMQRLEEVVAAVAAPVPSVGASQRDSAIAAALAADPGWDEQADGDDSGDVRSAKRAVPAWLVAAVVVLVLGLVALPFVRIGGDTKVGSGVGDVAAGRIDEEAAQSDLGSIEDPAQLNAALRQVLGDPPAGSAAGVEEFSAASPMAATADGDDGGSRERSSAEPKTLAECQPAAAAYAGPEHTALAYSAKLKFGSQPAYVFVFVRNSSDALSRQAVVVARSGCALLVVQSF